MTGYRPLLNMPNAFNTGCQIVSQAMQMSEQLDATERSGPMLLLALHQTKLVLIVLRHDQL